MQDKYQQRKYVHRGWKKMKVLLDREMPRDSRRHRIPLFAWLTGAAVALLLAGGLYLSTRDHSNAVDRKPAETSKPMASAPESLNRVEEDKQIPEKVYQENEEAGVGLNAVAAGIQVGDPEYLSRESQHARHPGSGPGDSEMAVPEAPVIDRSNAAFIVDQLQDVADSRQPVLEQALPHDLAGQEDIIETESVILPQHSDLARNASVLTLLSRTIYLEGAGHEMHLPAASVLPVLPGPGTLESKPHGNRFALGLRGSWNAAADGMLGLGGGPEIRWPLSRKVTMFSGLLYENQKKGGFLSFAKREDANLSTSPVTVINGPSGNVVNAVSMDVDAASVESLTNSFVFLHIPAGIEYFLGRSVSLEFGARYSRLLGAPSKEQIALVDDDQLQQDFNQLQDVSRNSFFEHDFVQKNDVSVLLGANVYLWRRLALHLEYNHGFFSIFKGGDDTISDSKNRMLSLGLRYHFSRV